MVTCAEGLSNISKKVNLGAQAAKGDLILLMKENVEAASPDWIERMLEHFEKPHVGVVGGKLLYPDRTIKSAGIVLRDCVPVDAGRNQPCDASGYFLSTCAARNFTAISGNCMMTKSDFAFWGSGEASVRRSHNRAATLIIVYVICYAWTHSRAIASAATQFKICLPQTTNAPESPRLNTSTIYGVLLLTATRSTI